MRTLYPRGRQKSEPHNARHVILVWGDAVGAPHTRILVLGWRSIARDTSVVFVLSLFRCTCLVTRLPLRGKSSRRKIVPNSVWLLCMTQQHLSVELCNVAQYASHESVRIWEADSAKDLDMLPGDNFYANLLCGWMGHGTHIYMSS